MKFTGLEERKIDLRVVKMKGREENGEMVDLKRCTAADEPTRTAGDPSAPTKNFRILK